MEPSAEDPEASVLNSESDSAPENSNFDSETAGESEDGAERVSGPQFESEGTEPAVIVRLSDISSHYTQRRRVAAPDRLMEVCSGRASSERGG